MTIRPKLGLRTAAAALAALSLMWIAPTAQAGAPTTPSDVAPLGAGCGWHTQNLGVYTEGHYNHCTGGSDRVEITLYRGNGTTGTKCVGPGHHILGPTGPFGVNYAEYNGNLC